MPGGRPPKYDPKFCDMVVEHCKNGESLTSFAASIGVCSETLRAWSHTHREFSAAYKRALANQQKYWENQLKMAARGEVLGEHATGKDTVQLQRHNVTALIFLMKARFNEYKEHFFEADPSLSHSALSSFTDDDESKPQTESSVQ